MIQRIQSLYLFVAAVLLTLALFMPWASFFGQEGELFQIKAFKVEQILGKGEQSFPFLGSWSFADNSCRSFFRMPVFIQKQAVAEPLLRI
jgi:hypothetical protein